MLNRSDADIQQDIQAEFKWEPSLRSENIALSVKNGVVTLAGYVDSYFDKWKAERVASRVKGVKAVANNIEVKLPSSSERPDPELAQAVAAQRATAPLKDSPSMNANPCSGCACELTARPHHDWNHSRLACAGQN